jgi:hypothetical protein
MPEHLSPVNASAPNPALHPALHPAPKSRRPRWIARWSTRAAVALVTVVAVAAGCSEQPESLQTIDAPASTTVAADTTVPTPTTADAPPTTPAPPPTTADAPPPTPAPAPTPTATSPLAPTPGAHSALEVLALIAVERETPDGYNRELFGYGAPVDSFGCRTRALVLIRDSLTPAQIDRGGCAVVAGDWFSTYDGVTWADPGEVQIDHVVALKEAWDSGASQWNADRLEAFANDVDEPRSLRAVTGSVNQAKGADDPVNWLPPDETAVCQYLADWVSIKARWGLTMDESEHGRVRNLLTNRCPGQLVADWVEVAPAVPTNPVAPSAPAPVSPAPAGAPTNNCDPSYPGVCIPPAPPDLDCGDIPFKRFQVLPPDPHNFDGRDSDGLGCES